MRGRWRATPTRCHPGTSTVDQPRRYRPDVPHGGVEDSQTLAAARLTARGAKTRSRIVATAADLMRVRGVGGTTLDDVVSASKASKSQLYRHFEDKPALVRAVIEFVGERTIAGERERLQNVRTFAGLRRWRDALVERNALQEGRYGCPLGSLANEVSDQDSVARRKLHDLFTAWQELFEDLLRRFQREGVIPQDADVAQLATGFVAAVQGGYLLAQTSRDVTPMASAIDMAIAHLSLLGRVSDGAS
jgi:TetR/AcrR family transcriptional regulator, transcriptional repressor for nem operon